MKRYALIALCSSIGQAVVYLSMWALTSATIETIFFMGFIGNAAGVFIGDKLYVKKYKSKRRMHKSKGVLIITLKEEVGVWQ